MTEYTVEFVGMGETTTVSGRQTILKAYIEEGIAQEYSRRVGMCLACSAKILEDDATQPAAYRLTEKEVERFALTCMTRPQSDFKLDYGVYPSSIEDDAMVASTAIDDD